MQKAKLSCRHVGTPVQRPRTIQIIPSMIATRYDLTKIFYDENELYSEIVVIQFVRNHPSKIKTKCLNSLATRARKHLFCGASFLPGIILRDSMG